MHIDPYIIFGSAIIGLLVGILRLVRWMVLGSVPAAFLGAYLLHALGDSKAAQQHIETVLGAALLVAPAPWSCASSSTAAVSGQRRLGIVHGLAPRPLPTIAIGVIGGVIVGMTSVGSGSLMIVLLLFVYPTIGANQLVGTDLTQAVPLTVAAALGALVFGHVEFGSATLLAGAVLWLVFARPWRARAEALEEPLR